MKRFALYFTPPADHPLVRAASSWLGRDAFGSPGLLTPLSNGFPREVWRAATSEPRRYGFHATLKPPFHLASGFHESDLASALLAFAASRPSFTLPPLQVARLSNFWALTLAAACPPLERLAAECVRNFDAFRAAPSEEELARRRRARLSPRQLEHLDQWGYPYVFEEWRFHMTLTWSLEGPVAEDFGTHLRSIFGPLCQGPVECDAITLFAQPSPGDPFQVIERFPFL